MFPKQSWAEPGPVTGWVGGGAGFQTHPFRLELASSYAPYHSLQEAPYRRVLDPG